MFRVVDEELPGNGPTIRIARTFQIRENDRFVETTGTTLGNWMLQVPTPEDHHQCHREQHWRLWMAGPGERSESTLLGIWTPGPVTFNDITRYWDDYEWWSGYQLVDDLGNEQELLRAGGRRIPKCGVQGSHHGQLALQLPPQHSQQCAR
jgi:hypothetical protein